MLRSSKEGQREAAQEVIRLEAIAAPAPAVVVQKQRSEAVGSAVAKSLHRIDD